MLECFIRLLGALRQIFLTWECGWGCKHMWRNFTGRNRSKTSANALARTVEEAWESCDSYRPFRNVFKRQVKVLWLIVNVNGDNDLVDEARHKVTAPIVIPPPSGTAFVEEEEEEEECDNVFGEDQEDIVRDLLDGGEEVPFVCTKLPGYPT